MRRLRSCYQRSRPTSPTSWQRSHADPRLLPLPPASESRRRKVLALARDGKRYAVYVEDPNTDPVIAALATPAGTYEVQIPRDRYHPFAVLATVRGWERERVALNHKATP